MSIILEASYSKKLGLPNFSSHQFSVSVRAEVTSLRRVETETRRLYRILQESVDKQVEQVGFLPDGNYGMIVDLKPRPNGVSPGDRNRADVSSNRSSSCSDKQRAFIANTAKRMRLSSRDLDEMCNHLFNVPAKELDKRQASQLIDKLFEMDGRPQRGNGTPASRTLAAAAVL